MCRDAFPQLGKRVEAERTQAKAKKKNSDLGAIKQWRKGESIAAPLLECHPLNLGCMVGESSV